MYGRKPRDEKATTEKKIPSNPRQEMKNHGRIINQTKSKQMIKQELTSHLQNFRENFNEAELHNWKVREVELIHQLTSL